jgi:hypothetical protein
MAERKKKAELSPAAVRGGEWSKGTQLTEPQSWPAPVAPLKLDPWP